jgi:uncharacterized protein YndB with AHSA1/START domain
MGTAVSDRIEKEVLLKAPLARVWQALTNSKEFGIWFGVTFEGPFVAGSPVWGTVTMTQMDDEVAKHQKPYEGMRFQVFVERIEPQSAFSFRWNPSGADVNFDAARDPMTLVTFTLHQVADGVLLKVVESGFDQVSAERRAKAFTENEQGWIMQMMLIRKYVEKAS